MVSDDQTPVKRAVLHIGTHKTGTTSLQIWFDAASEVMSQQGVLYPVAGRPDSSFEDRYGHHRLAFGVQKKYGVNGTEDWDRVKREAELSRANTLLLSSENFTHLDADGIELVRELLSDYDVHIVVCFRNPADFLVSSWKQGVKTGKCDRTFEQWVAAVGESRARYGDIVARWEQVFGKDHVRVLLYDRCRAEKTLEQSIADVVGVPMSLIADYRQAPANTSPTSRQIAALQLLNLLRRKSGWLRMTGLVRRAVLRSSGVGYVLGSVAGTVMTTGAERRHLAPIRESIDDCNRQLVGRYIDESEWHYLACSL